jgi:tetratricopeptide (TPR) repeat protein
VLEKAPLFVLSAASSVVTYRVQAGGGAVNIMEGYHLAGRLQNALTAYLGYLVKTVWPSCLILPYTLTRESFALPKVLLAALVLAGVGAAAVHLRRRFPPLAVGWLWYLGTLVPVIGLVQVGSQAMADRYTYVPLTGLFLAGAWAWASAYRGRPARRPLLAGGALLALALLSWLSFRQAGFWRDSGTLFTHTLDCDPKSFVAHNNLGAHHSDRKDYARAMEHIREALRINAFFAEAHYNLGNVLVRTGRVAESVEHFRAALHGKPDMAMAHNNLGLALASLGRMAEAGDALSRALALQPDSPEALYNLGYLRYLEGRPAEAERLFLRSLARNPSSFEAHNVLGIVYAQQGRVDDAVRHFETALSLNPADQFTRQNLEKARRMAGR